ncbi:MAG: hypothetical protein KDD35_09050, partial [Bdellovibrionales bacterium]|nr:hypothetical protein [Bdellovibrionales bacterium]
FNNSITRAKAISFLFASLTVVLILTSRSDAKAAIYGYVTVTSSQKLHLRGSPQSRSRGYIKPGDRAILLKPINHYNYWVKIKYRGKIRWVRKGAARPFETSASQSQDQPVPSAMERATEASTLCKGGNCHETSNWPSPEKLRISIPAMSSTAESNTSTHYPNLFSAIEQAAEVCRMPSRSKRKKTGRTRICGRKNSKGLCYRAVKEALKNSKMVDYKLPGGHAIEAHSKGYLKRAGFTNYIGKYSAYNAPVGCVLVYSGGRSGHIEMVNHSQKMGREYCSDFCSKRPVSAYLKRRLRGVYCK